MNEQRLHEKYGHVIRIGPNSLAFSSLSAFEAIYGFNKSLEKGSFYDFGRDGRSRGGSIFTARTDAIHAERRRKVVGPAITSSKIASYQPVISKHTSNLVLRVAQAAQPQKDAITLNLAPYIHSFTFDTLAEIIYGELMSSKPYTDTREAYGILSGFRNLSKWAWAGSLLPWLGWIMSTPVMVYLTRRPTHDQNGNLTGISALAARTRNVVFRQPFIALDSNQPSILKYYLQVPEADSKHMAPDQIWRECFNLTFAGPGSTAAALTAVLYQLGTNEGQEWQDRVRRESSAMDITTINEPVLVAVIKETLRLQSPFPTGFPRSIAPGAQTAIPDLSAPLPVGTTVYANPYVLGHSKEIWGSDAEEWKPQRWLEIQSGDKPLEEKFVVFSKGPRGCIGRDIALLILAQAVTKMVRRWNIRADGILKGQSFLEMQYTDCGVSLTEMGTSGR